MLQDQLNCLYEATWKNLLAGLPKNRGISNPLFIHVPDAYEGAKVRLMIVGKETNSWGSEPGFLNDAVRVEQLTEMYKNFCLGKAYIRSPFWFAAHDLQRRLDPAVPPFGFVWSNLFLCDQNATTPENDIADKLREMSILKEEIKILQPTAVVFFTGWNPYDYTIKNLFPGIVPNALDGQGGRLLARLSHTGLPFRSYRTYHPKYLRLRGKMSVLEKIAQHIMTDTVDSHLSGASNG